jgi:hypothetical protein
VDEVKRIPDFMAKLIDAGWKVRLGPLPEVVSINIIQGGNIEIGGKARKGFVENWRRNPCRTAREIADAATGSGIAQLQITMRESIFKKR